MKTTVRLDSKHELILNQLKERWKLDQTVDVFKNSLLKSFEEFDLSYLEKTLPLVLGNLEEIQSSFKNIETLLQKQLEDQEQQNQKLFKIFTLISQNKSEEEKENFNQLFPGTFEI